MSKIQQDTIYSITAHIDLLGFSSHLILSSYDLRTKIGEEAIQRLRIIESATEFIEKELISCKEFYPETFRFLRFNDSLILGIDINAPILPRIGKPNEGESFSYKEIEDFFGKDSKNNNLTEKLKDHFDKESFKVCQFLGIVSRVHNYINQKEFEMHMAGCRTIISSGLRHKFINKKDNKEDYYSANFSLSNAYIVNDIGSKGGFSGSKCYIENNVAKICGSNIYAKRILGFAKYIRNDSEQDPFNGITNGVSISNLNYTESKIISVDLFNKKYNFRELNTIVASNLQLFPSILKLTTLNIEKENGLKKSIISSLNNDTPDIKALNQKSDHDIISNPHLKYPFLFLTIGLQEKISELLKQLEK